MEGTIQFWKELLNIPEDYEAHFLGGGASPVKSIEELYSNSDYSSFHVSATPEKSARECPPEKLNLFSATVARCKSEGVELLVLVSPQYSYRSNAFLNAIADLQEVAEKSGCEVYDYSDLYLDDPTKFKDANHMNHKGAVAFTKMVIEEHLRGER